MRLCCLPRRACPISPPTIIAHRRASSAMVSVLFILNWATVNGARKATTGKPFAFTPLAKRGGRCKYQGRSSACRKEPKSRPSCTIRCQWQPRCMACTKGPVKRRSGLRCSPARRRKCVSRPARRGHTSIGPQLRRPARWTPGNSRRHNSQERSSWTRRARSSTIVFSSLLNGFNLHQASGQL